MRLGWTNSGGRLEVREKPVRVAWGAGRVAFRASLADIQDQLNAGWPMSTVHRRLQGSLAGLSYRGFVKLAAKYLSSAPKQRTRKNDVTNQSAQSAGLARIAEPITVREQTNDNKTITPGKPAKFRPGPRIPDPRDLY